MKGLWLHSKNWSNFISHEKNIADVIIRLDIILIHFNIASADMPAPRWDTLLEYINVNLCSHFLQTSLYALSLSMKT